MPKISNEITTEMKKEVEESGGLKRVVFGAEGAKVEEIPQSSIDRAEKNLDNETKKVASALDLLAALSPNQDVLIEECEIEVKGSLTTFYIKRLSYAECSKVDAKRYRRKADGQLDFNSEYAATTGIGYQLASCLMRNDNADKLDDEGKAIVPNWLPLFTLEQVVGKGGLMTSPDPDAKDLIYKLLNEIWILNPEISPFNQAQSLGATGTQ